jgi:hypothetical protein
MKLFKDQRGIGHVVEIVIIAVIVLGVAGFIVWRVWGSQNNSSSNNNPAQSALEQAVANANCTYDDKDFCKFMTSWKLGMDLKVESIQTGSDGISKSTFVSTQKGANTYVAITSKGVLVEIINIGTTRYAKTTDGTWWKQTVEMSSGNAYTEAYEPTFEEPDTTNASGKPSYKKIGTEACGNFTCFKYQVVDPVSPNSTGYIWFDNQTYQLRRLYTESPEGKFEQSYTYENISVNVPSPVKDLPEGQYILPGADAPIATPSASDVVIPPSE